MQCTEIQCAALHFGLKNAVQCIVFQCSLAQCTVLQFIAISEGFVYSSLYHLQSLLLDKIHICILVIDFDISFDDDNDDDNYDDDDRDDDDDDDFDVDDERSLSAD